MHVVYRDAAIPVIFALLPNKTQSTYRHLIEKLCELCPSWNPKYLMMDFEKAAAMNVFGDKFTANTIRHRCLVVFCIWKAAFGLKFK